MADESSNFLHLATFLNALFRTTCADEGSFFGKDCHMIDWSRVNELRDEVGAEDFEEVVELFLEEVEEVIEETPKDE